MSGSTNITMDLQTAHTQNQPIVERFCSSIDQLDYEAVVECMRNIYPKNITYAYPDSWWDADDENFGIPGPDPSGYNESGLMIVDGYLMPEPLADALAKGLNDVPLIIGNTQYEADYSPYEEVRNYSTEDMFGRYLNHHFRAWGATFGEDLWKRFYQNEWE